MVYRESQKELHVYKYHVLSGIPQITEARMFSPWAPVAPHQTPTDPVRPLLPFFTENKWHLAAMQGHEWQCSNRKSELLPDIGRQRQLRSPTNRRLSLCPRLPTVHRAPPSLCSRCRRASASVRWWRFDSCFCGLWQTRWETWWRWL